MFQSFLEGRYMTLMTIYIKFGQLCTLASDYNQLSLTIYELHIKNEQKWTKFINLTLKYDLLTLKMTPAGFENVTIELTVLKKPHFDPKNVFLALLEVILVQDSS